MKTILLAFSCILLFSFVCTDRRGFELYHTFYELPGGEMKFFYCEIGKLKDVRVEYKQKDITSRCKDYDKQRNEVWKDCTIPLGIGEKKEEGIVSYKMATSGSISVVTNGVERHAICGHKVNATTCLIAVFGNSIDPPGNRV